MATTPVATTSDLYTLHIPLLRGISRFECFFFSALIMGGALIIFGATDNSLWSNNRSEWVFGKNPYSENELFWSFWLAVAGSSLLFLCGLSYFIEGQRQEIAVPVPKPVTVTTVYYPSGQDFIPYTAV